MVSSNCNCRQVVIKAGAEAEPWVDFRDTIAALDPGQQAASVGASNYRLLEAGVIRWEDVVTKYRVRDLREVVAIKNLDVKQLLKAGVRKSIAEKAYESVNTPAHQLVAQKRSQLIANLNGAGLSTPQIRQILSSGLAARVVGKGPTGRVVKLPASGGSTDQRIRSFLSMWIDQKPPTSRPKPEPKPRPKSEPPAEIEVRIKDDVRDEEEAIRHVVRTTVPPAMARALADADLLFVYAKRTFDVMGHAAREHPPGWAEGTTWENAEGYFDAKKKMAVATREYKDKRTGEYVRSNRVPGVIRHELGHAVDKLLGAQSKTESFRAAYQADVAELSEHDRKDKAYYLQPGNAGPSEAFAELFGQVRGGGSRDDMTDVFPETTRWITEFIERWKTKPATSSPKKAPTSS